MEEKRKLNLRGPEVNLGLGRSAIGAVELTRAKTGTLEDRNGCLEMRKRFAGEIPVLQEVEKAP